MKKILLLAALAVGAFTAQAETFGEIFRINLCHKVTVDDGSDSDGGYKFGEEISDGQTIVINDYFDEVKQLYPDDPEMWEFSEGFKAESPLAATNISDEPWMLAYEFSRVEPSLTDFPASDLMGFYQGCFEYNGQGNCVGKEDGKVVIFNPFDFSSYFKNGIEPEDFLFVNLEVNNFKDLTPRTLRLDFKVMANKEEVYDNATFTCYIKFTNEIDTTASVSGIGADSSEAVYYNLQGVRVANPEKGLFIKKQGSKTTKVIL